MMRLKETEKEALTLFWQWSGQEPSYPCHLETLVELALPISLVKQENLSVHKVESWLQRHGIPHGLGERSRTLRGCLVAWGGQGFIFLDATDEPNEQRFTLAHEIVHFFLDYLMPRQKAVAQFGEEIIAVLDGYRKPTIPERLSAFLQNVHLGVKSDLIAREDGTMSLDTLNIETTVDRVALELLAPRQRVQKQLPNGRDYQTRRNRLTDMLISNYGLPASIADLYAGQLLHKTGKGRESFIDELRRTMRP